ncbi:hypothetical protein L218DRAFT_957250 [Marasmius fiardii PR-910]|nr:hypothetical protein L218DRAFT_957250 [Marasmius fiardii PR-910]
MSVDPWQLQLEEAASDYLKEAHVVHGRSRKAAICLAAAFAVGPYKVVMIRETQGAFEIYYYRISGGRCPPQFSGEDAATGNSTVTLGFIMMAVYELVVLILTLIKASKQGWLGLHGSESRFINGFLSQGVAYNCLILDKYFIDPHLRHQ